MAFNLGRGLEGTAYGVINEVLSGFRSDSGYAKPSRYEVTLNPPSGGRGKSSGLNTNLISAQEGSVRYVKAFEDLGFAVDDVVKMDAEERVFTLLEALAQVDDQTQQTSPNTTRTTKTTKYGHMQPDAIKKPTKRNQKQPKASQGKKKHARETKC